MPVTRVKKNAFTGLAKLFDAADDGLNAIVRKLAQQDARSAILGVTPELTDNSTGAAVATYVLPALAPYPAAFTEAGTASAPKAGFDTALTKAANAQAVLAEFMNRMSARLGLPLITDGTGGTIATVGTIPSQDKTTTAVASSCLDVVTGRARMATIYGNLYTLALAARRIGVAVGHPVLDLSGFKITGVPGSIANVNNASLVLGAITASGSSVTGASNSTIANADSSAFLTASASIVATIAQYLNDVVGAALTDLTDSSTGTASLTTLAANTLPVLVDGAATTSAPKAGFDTELTAIKNGIADLALRTNLMLRRQGRSDLLTDSSTGTADTTIAALGAALVAVDGSTGTVAVSGADALARMTTINNAISSLAAKLNTLAPLYGERQIADALGGTVSSTLAAISATGTGVSGVGVCLLNTAVNTWLTTNKNNIATLAAMCNRMTGAEVVDRPLQVVAFDI